MTDAASDWEALYLRHRQAIWAFFWVSLHDRERAMDGVQDVFLQAWRYVDRLRTLHPTEQKAWLYQTARRRLIDIHRHQVVVDRADIQMALDVTSPSTADPMEVIEHRERLQAISAIVQGLPPKQRAVFILATVGEMTGTEIAELLAIPSATVRSRLAAARRRLIRELHAETSRPGCSPNPEHYQEKAGDRNE
jgi:RNA polymerase sigma-70 factor (ECF subfamily)